MVCPALRSASTVVVFPQPGLPYSINFLPKRKNFSIPAVAVTVFRAAGGGGGVGLAGGIGLAGAGAGADGLGVVGCVISISQ